ncbi:pyridine nucleotide-disulfide oxidoreductase/dicluster-binding protein [Desulfosporosinus meridiei]|uniref:NADPH-dependent glutamate synthase beta chain-like oxidoreductase n=1 Tax=Desulfosporosinus meridiei (strain ATCC BAA-275 / DSM 13257 / KCTC 12902 / NCIMB 13706 / S10) TaxID=768704 RepID=J7ISM5_DESMD|nr:pyridine nucleotide-disulfide oxidoreductase/dicluster-binding protein [Desulfosporosinus meridiei]AFQ43189.1 NADPH-dependent glutamate synthase beta chain-like oxidoreductase [Desulfosporosinus meridiei DSM 13257]
MDQDELKKQEAKCTQESPPACTAGCPIHVDVRKLMTDIQKQDWKSALATLQKKQPFPGIIGRICDHPCEAVCLRQDVGTAVAISALEGFCVQNHYAKVKMGIVPSKSQTVAIVGSGLRGLTAAYDLAKKGYKVSLFEKTDRLGGYLWSYPKDQLPSEIIVEELSVLSRLNVQIHLNTAITSQDLGQLQGKFNVLYLGLAENSPEITELLGEQLQIDPATCATLLPGIFGGSYAGNNSLINSVADGRKAAVSMDRYLQGVSLTASREGEGAFETQLYVNTRGIDPLSRVPMSNSSQGYTLEEALQEAGRCLDCQCLECVKACKYMQEYGSYPKKYLRQIYNNDTIVMGMRHGNKMINSCSLCGQCAEICPQGLDLGVACKATRESMVSKGKMPPSAHDFALRDMTFNNSAEFTLTRHQPGHTSSKYVFFPGCQLSGSSPERVKQVYAYLTDKLSGGVALLLRCCNAPADWAGDQELFQNSLKDLVNEWESLGKPQIIVACSTCHSIFRERFPEVVSLWELMADLGLPEQGVCPTGVKLAVQDPCTTRNEPNLQAAVRQILQELGCEIEELPYSKERTKCCGFGGLTSFANPNLGKKIVEDRIQESSTDYVAYCAMCRDNFASQGKRTVHLLDLMFDTNFEEAALRPRVGLSYRHENRAKLKSTLLDSLWKEVLPKKDVAYLQIKLQLDERVLGIMEERRILIEDIQRVIELAEGTGRKFVNPDNGHSLAYFRPVKVTYWVEYQEQEQGFVVLNVYSHRMEIVEEGS